MEEADVLGHYIFNICYRIIYLFFVLGDRVVIMAHGKAQCNGSPLYLKRLLGDGYTLSMTKDESCDTQAASALVKNAIHGANLKVTKNELIFNLPVSEIANFPDLFEKLDQAKHSLHVYNIGIKVTTMEDVFLKVANLGMWHMSSLHKLIRIVNKQLTYQPISLPFAIKRLMFFK